MATGAYIDGLIDTSVRNYPPEAFHNMALNTILHLINQNAGSGGGGSGSASFATTFVTGASFSSATNCPIVSLNGFLLAIFYNDANKYLKKGVDWTPLVGGGFTILMPGFNATTTNINDTFVLTPAAV